jgi:ketosteroid isomerase-like protein
MKAFASLLAALLLLGAVAGCGGDDDDPERASTGGAETTESAGTATTETAEEPGDDEGGSADGGGGSGGGAQAGGGGGSADERRAVTDVVIAYHRALGDGDGREACSLLADRMRTRVEKALESSPQLEGRGCAGAIGLITENYPERIKKALGDVQIREVTVDGDSAKASYRVGSLPATTMPLERERDGWRVAAVAGS